MQTTQYKFFRASRLCHLKRHTDTARQIWNYFLGWQKLRHSLGNLPYMNFHAMSREFTILRNAHPDMFPRWRELDSWASRDILLRLHRAYERFFKYCKQKRKGGKPRKVRPRGSSLGGSRIPSRCHPQATSSRMTVTPFAYSVKTTDSIAHVR